MPAPPAAGAAAAAAGLAAPGLAFSTSDLTIRPRGPEPDSAERSMPLPAAMRLASGEAKMRAPSVFVAGAAAAGAAAAFRAYAFAAGATSAFTSESMDFISDDIT